MLTIGSYWDIHALLNPTVFIISEYIIFIDVRGIAVIIRTGKTNTSKMAKFSELAISKKNRPGIRAQVKSVCELYKFRWSFLHQMKEKLSYIKVISCLKDKMSMGGFDLTRRTFVFWNESCFNRHQVNGERFLKHFKEYMCKQFFPISWLCLKVSFEVVSHPCLWFLFWHGMLV